MTLLQRLLAALVSQKVQEATALEEHGNSDPLTTSLRIPGEVRRQYEHLAAGLGTSMQQAMLLSLRALVEQGWQHPETTLIAKRLQRVFDLHDIHAVDVRTFHPALSAETLHDELALLRVADRDLTEVIGKALHLNPKWLAGERFASPALNDWYNHPYEPVAWAKARKERTVVGYVIRIQGARWDQVIPDDDYNNPQPQTQMAIILHSYERKNNLGYPVYCMWSFERISYDRARTVARIILSRLSKLDVQLRGITISEEVYSHFQEKTLFPIELVKSRLEWLGWSVKPLLYGADGPYRHEDAWLQHQEWAGGAEFSRSAQASEES